MSTAPPRPITPPLPKGTKPLSHQIAGHKYGKGKTKLGKQLMSTCSSPPFNTTAFNFLLYDVHFYCL